MAGWDASEMMAGLPSVINLAVASGEDLGRVSDILTDGLTSFQMTAQDSARFSDVLAMSANKSNTSVSMLGESFKYIGSVAGAMGYSVEDVGIQLGLLAFNEKVA